MPNAALLSIGLHGLSELALAFRMSMMNVEQMRLARKAAKDGLQVRQIRQQMADFLQAPYYRSWSRAQLNNTEYAPMLALLCFVIKYRADQERQGELRLASKVACVGSVVFSYMFIYAAATQGAVDPKNIRPGAGGMSPLRPMGAMGRYLMMGLLIFEALR